MNTLARLLHVSLLAAAPLLCQCSATKPQAPAAAGPVTTKSKAAPTIDTASKPVSKDDLDEYAVVDMPDPLEKLNRGTFWLNDKMYLVLFRPLSKGYEAVTPKRLRKGIYNAFENVKFPVRLVNSLLQGKVKGAGLQTEKFLVDTVAGLGGMIRVSKDIPSLANLPDEDTGKTFARWGMGHGCYIVVPFLGPSSLRDGVGLIGDYAMNPAYWGYFSPGSHDWTMIPPYANTLRAMPAQLGLYDDAKRDAIDPYISIRNAYTQFRDEAVKK